MIREALTADAALAPAESLYLPAGLILADGQWRTRSPRFAGLEPGGQVAVTSSQVQISGNIAWALVEYL